MAYPLINKESGWLPLTNQAIISAFLWQMSKLIMAHGSMWWMLAKTAPTLQSFMFRHILTINTNSPNFMLLMISMVIILQACSMNEQLERITLECFKCIRMGLMHSSQAGLEQEFHKILKLCANPAFWRE